MRIRFGATVCQLLPSSGVWDEVAFVAVRDPGMLARSILTVDDVSVRRANCRGLGHGRG